MSDTTGSGRRPADGETSDTGDRIEAIGAAVGLTIVAIVVSLVVGVALVIPVVLLEYDVESTPVFVGLTAAGQLGFFLVAYLYARRRNLRIPLARPTGREVGLALSGTVGALVVAWILSAILATLDLVPGSTIEEVAASNPTILLGMAGLSVVLVAPVEEFLFRGVVQGRLRQEFGPVGAIIGSSLLFGSVHLANYTGAIESIVAGALLIAGSGVVLGALYELTRNLAVPIVVHALYNVVVLVGAYLML